MMYQLILVEDDDQIRNGLSRFFPWEQLGFTLAACFDNGLYALEYVRTHAVDIILTDVRMPVMDGLEMLEKMRLENLDAYVVILSAFRDFTYAQRAIELGVSNYIVKSTKYDELVRVFQKIHESLESGQRGMDIHADQPPAEMSGEVLDKIKSYIRDNIASATLQSTAEHVKYSPIYLSRLFKEKSGMNFVNFIIQERMRRAAELLHIPGQSMNQISEAVGYSNEKNFSRAFKKYYGISPAEYRKLL
jgi:two-component system response regulator YesN